MFGKTEIVELLLNQPEGTIDLNVKDIIEGQTAFMLSCLGFMDVVKLLLKHSDKNIDYNAKDNNGESAFNLACRHGQADVVQILLEYSNIVDVTINEYIQLSPAVKDLIERHHLKNVEK